MSHLGTDHFPIVPESWSSPQEHLRKLSQAINGILRGQCNNTDEVTLDASVTETTLESEKIVQHTVVVLSPRTSSAAAVSGLYITTTKGSATLHHDSSPATDRTFGVVLHN